MEAKVPSQIHANAQDSGSRTQDLRPPAPCPAIRHPCKIYCASYTRTHVHITPSAGDLRPPSSLDPFWVLLSRALGFTFSSISFFIHLQSHNLYYLHRRLCFGFSYGNGFSYGFSYSPAFRFQPCHRLTPLSPPHAVHPSPLRLRFFTSHTHTYTDFPGSRTFVFPLPFRTHTVQKRFA